MADPVVTGPLEYVSAAGSAPVPLYVVAYDEDGVCTSPETARRAVEEAAGASDVFLLSHGWNNDWDTMLDRYRGWISQLLELRPAGGPDHFRPVFIGVFWPSIVAPESVGWGPNLAGGSDTAWQDEVLAYLTAGLTAADTALVTEKLRQPVLDPTESAELAEKVLGKFSGPDSDITGPDTDPDSTDPVSTDRPDEADPADQVCAAELRRKWLLAQDSEDPTPSGPVLIDDAPTDTSAVTAGLWDRLKNAALKPIWLLRFGSVLLMKDRSGRIGGFGVAELLENLLAAVGTSTRVHLLGHSYGSKVMLSALCRSDGTRPVDSVLLFEPALSARAFAADADDHGTPGGYRPALDRSRTGITLTYSSHDFPLTRLFHLAARRNSDLGEVVIAGGARSAYAALGGFGPARVDELVDRCDPAVPPAHYPRPTRGRILAIRGDDIIPGHGDVVSPATARILADQIRP